MKLQLIFSCLVIATACSTSKEVVVEEKKEVIVEQAEVTDLVGKVRTSEECELYLETYEGGKLVTMYPVNLDDNLKQNGVKISFTYILSKAKQPENCRVDKVVVLENVKQMH
jgi:hypothetical protein